MCWLNVIVLGGCSKPEHLITKDYFHLGASFCELAYTFPNYILIYKNSMQVVSVLNSLQPRWLPELQALQLLWQLCDYWSRPSRTGPTGWRVRWGGAGGGQWIRGPLRPPGKGLGTEGVPCHQEEVQKWGAEERRAGADQRGFTARLV